MLNGPEPEHHVRRNAGHQQHDVDPDGAEQQVDRVEARRRNPVHILGRMMDGVVFPEAAAMEHAVQPVHHEIGSDQEQDRLQPQRQRRQRAMAVVVEGDQFVGVVNPEQQAGAEHQQPDPEHAREQRHQEPVAEVGHELALAPPGPAGIAGPEMRQHREHQRQRDRDRHHLGHGLAEHLDDFDRQVHLHRVPASRRGRQFAARLRRASVPRSYRRSIGRANVQHGIFVGIDALPAVDMVEQSTAGVVGVSSTASMS